MPNSLLILSRKDLSALLTMPEAIDQMAQAFGSLAEGGVQAPIRTHLHLAAHGAEALFMPVYSASAKRSALKMVSLSPQNQGTDRPMIQAMCMLMDTETGAPLALMEAGFLTALRTGAASGLATRLLADPHADTLALFGAGRQALPQIEAVCAVRSIKHLLLFNRTVEKATQLAEAAAAFVSGTIAVNPPMKTLLQAQVICTATSTQEAIVPDRYLSLGTHINAVGAYRKDMRELEAQTVGRSWLVVDQRAACLIEAGDIIRAIDEGAISPDHIQAELGYYVHRPLETRPQSHELTLFKSVGNAIQDLCLAHYAHQKASQMGLGQWVEL